MSDCCISFRANSLKHESQRKGRGCEARRTSKERTISLRHRMSFIRLLLFFFQHKPERLVDDLTRSLRIIVRELHRVRQQLQELRRALATASTEEDALRSKARIVDTCKEMAMLEDELCQLEECYDF